LVRKLLVERIAVVSFVPDEPLRITRNPETIEGVFDQSHFSRRSAFCPSGDRKTIAVNDCRDLGSFTHPCSDDKSPPVTSGKRSRDERCDRTDWEYGQSFVEPRTGDRSPN